MPLRQPPLPTTAARTAKMRVPQCWLVVDERARASLIAAMRALPPRSAIVVRPDALDPVGRAALLRQIRRCARARRHILLMTAPHDRRGYDGSFGAGRTSAVPGFVAMPVHDARETGAARRARATAVLISPLFATRSHPGAAGIGLRGFARLARALRCPAIALGGMDAARFVAARRQGARGWAAIDAWMSG